MATFKGDNARMQASLYHPRRTLASKVHARGCVRGRAHAHHVRAACRLFMGAESERICVNTTLWLCDRLQTLPTFRVGENGSMHTLGVIPINLTS